MWLVPMTSSASTDNASTGIVLFDTRDNTGRLYRLTGPGVTANVQSTLASNPANLRGYQVSNVQLYDIYGEPTWVATFYEPNPFGEIFQAIGLVDARHLSGSHVIMAPNKSQALAEYAQWLSENDIQTGKISPTGAQVTVQGKVASHLLGSPGRHNRVQYVAGRSAAAHLRGWPGDQSRIAPGTAWRHGSRDLSRHRRARGYVYQLYRFEPTARCPDTWSCYAHTRSYVMRDHFCDRHLW